MGLLQVPHMTTQYGPYAQDLFTQHWACSCKLIRQIYIKLNRRPKRDGLMTCDADIEALKTRSTTIMIITKSKINMLILVGSCINNNLLIILLMHK